MSQTLRTILALVESEDWRISDHALLRLDEHGILASDLADRIAAAEMIEDYPDYHAGPCVLLLQSDAGGPVHALWGLQKGTARPAVLVTAYRPDPDRWLDDKRTRRP